MAATQVEGNSKLPKVILKHPSGSVCEIYINGATVTSFKNAKGDDIIMMSSTPIFQEGKGIRGGIPICWPQFGPGAIPQHGFARSSNWQFKGSEVKENGPAEATFTLSDSETTRKVWDNAFELESIISIDAEQFTQTLRVTNRNKDKDFNFTAALHTYFNVSAVGDVKLHNFGGLTYVDKTNNNSKQVESRNIVDIPKFTDSVYLNAPDKVELEDAKSKTTITKSNFKDVVVWNPWEEGAKNLADMGNDDWKTFVCVESATAFLPGETVKAGETWVGYVHIFFKKKK